MTFTKRISASWAIEHFLNTMASSILVLGAGMVGTCTALHLQQRGFDVVLVDRRAPGQETSLGNAGLIQREAVEPYAFPREAGFCSMLP